ncbi:hypothetical protein TRVL_08305 [Trypanosoma vivax]|nr:hypothetical protein TRVL_08305 [Trypanosoma vivax]
MVDSDGATHVDRTRGERGYGKVRTAQRKQRLSSNESKRQMQLTTLTRSTGAKASDHVLETSTRTQAGTSRERFGEREETMPSVPQVTVAGRMDMSNDHSEAGNERQTRYFAQLRRCEMFRRQVSARAGRTPTGSFDLARFGGHNDAQSTRSVAVT